MSSSPIPNSAESRAVARALLAKRKAEAQPTQFDKDARTLTDCVLDCATVPDSAWLDATSIGKRGLELLKQSAEWGEVWSRNTLASLFFRTLHGREPIAGDVLAYSDVQLLYSPAVNAVRVKHVREAWERQFPDVQCPVRCDEQGRIWKTRRGDSSGREWGHEMQFDAARNWLSVEYYVMDAAEYHRHSHKFDSNWQFQPDRYTPAIVAVVFTGLSDGKHGCRAATAEEAAGHRGPLERLEPVVAAVAATKCHTPATGNGESQAIDSAQR